MFCANAISRKMDTTEKPPATQMLFALMRDTYSTTHKHVAPRIFTGVHSCRASSAGLGVFGSLSLQRTVCADWLVSGCSVLHGVVLTSSVSFLTTAAAISGVVRNSRNENMKPAWDARECARSFLLGSSASWFWDLACRLCAAAKLSACLSETLAAH